MNTHVPLAECSGRLAVSVVFLLSYYIIFKMPCKPQYRDGYLLYLTYVCVAGPSIMARVELSGLSGDEVSTQANFFFFFFSYFIFVNI